MRGLPVTLLVLLALGGLARPAAAQAADCSYDRCALRLQTAAFTDRIVQGTEATPVARLGLFAPRIEPLAGARGHAGVLYETFRTRQNRAGAFQLVGILANVAAIITFYSWDTNNRLPDGFVPLALVGTGFSIAGGLEARRARDDLHQAMWHYNRNLTTAP